MGGRSLRFDIKRWKEWEMKGRAAERELSTVTSRYIGGHSSKDPLFDFSGHTAQASRILRLGYVCSRGV